ncbi:hypothetical protein CSUB01_02001 [Colletotrichum sublineola]|uniref:Uncharacterized protein n=1 Tax=Colletotrichum sublineola TaxID=1173701 RepID=A0A066XX74_COLSU|nr:hypothetical protein CSUB01_02001 [Colletotrichum sublineola]
MRYSKEAYCSAFCTFPLVGALGNFDQLLLPLNNVEESRSRQSTFCQWLNPVQILGLALRRSTVVWRGMNCSGQPHPHTLTNYHHPNEHRPALARSHYLETPPWCQKPLIPSRVLWTLCRLSARLDCAKTHTGAQQMAYVALQRPKVDEAAEAERARLCILSALPVITALWETDTDADAERGPECIVGAFLWSSAS